MKDDDFPPGTPPAVFVPLAQIGIPERLRPVDEAWVEALAASMEDHGLEQPIVVRPCKVTAVDIHAYQFILVAGAHRFSAAQSLRWLDIACVVRDIDEDEARLVEIDENLMRRELGALDRGIFLLERKTVYERLQPQAKRGGDRRSFKWQTLPFDPKRFTAEVADKVGLSERAVRMAIEIASKLDPDTISLLRGTKHADNQQTLLALSREPNPAKQRSLAQAMRDGAKTVHGARIAVGDETPAIDNPQERHFATLLSTWMLADPVTKKRFLDAIDAAFLTVEAAEKAQPKPRRGGRP